MATATICCGLRNLTESKSIGSSEYFSRTIALSKLFSESVSQLGV
ncbi:hypothetical protein CIHG_08751 [Coccidioides immitis H538.4]|uniref:Uncharacterized protein n=3 Tax=Coccidioides immitis TaxID=5501 RepID=A0A0J8R0K1_COCIT|nr:hypothetical protein CIRG_09454 [Coccidioides immitis RMSCC 2394]KMU78251.1 hypothetical protein CISG_06404 [Coccidioides immitis RMSCC 3703]KMU91081.1 hypothetical protein CIHG_08751 [Coccidioides immitis H538.4]